MAKLTTEIRIDRAELRLNAERTPEGYLKGTVKMAKAGVYPYRNADGSVRYEFVDPQELFRAATMDSFRDGPVTLRHPKEMVSAANAKDVKVGHVCQDVRADAPYMVGEIVIHDAEALRAIENGLQELSTGYFADVVEESGVFDGQAYQYRQTNIRGNHLALVEMARFGPELRINAVEPMAIRTEAEPRHNSNPNREKPMKKIVINGIEYEAAPEVLVELARVNALVETLKTEKVTLQASLDTAAADRDAKKAELEKVQNEMPGKIKEAAAARAKLEAAATKVLDAEQLKKLNDMSDLDIKKAVVLAKDPKAKLDGQTDTYVQVRFDLATENLADDAADRALAESRRNAAPPAAGGGNGGETPPDQDAARKNMIDRHRKGWQPKKDDK